MATKDNLVNIIYEKIDYLPNKRIDINHAVNLVFNYIQEELTKGNRIEIRGFGSLSIRNRKTAGSDNYYKTVYYRVAKKVIEKVNLAKDD